MTAHHRSLALAAALVGLAIGFWHFRIVGPVHLPQPVTGWNSDLYTIYVPVFTFAYRADAPLPTWNPHQLAGVPFLANYNAGVLYPPNLLARIVPVPRALAWLSIAHLAAAGILTVLLTRALRLSFAAAALAAIGVMLEGYLLVEIFRPSYLAAIAWVPGVVLAAARVVERPSAVAGVVLGTAVTLQVLTGIAQLTCYLAYVLLLVAPVALLQRRWSPGDARRLAVALAVAGTVAMTLAAVQLTPTIELVGRAVRGFGGLTVKQTMPETPSAERLWAILLMAGPLLVPAVVALADGSRLAVVVTAVVVFACTTLVSIGSPLYTRVFYHLPGVKLFRVPHEIAHIGVLALGVLAGLGLDKARHASPGWPVARRVLAIGAAAALLLVPMPSATRAYAAALVVVLAVVLFAPDARIRTVGAWAVVALFAAERFAQAGNTVKMPVNDDAAYFRPPPFVDFLRTRSEGGRILVVKDWRQRFPIMEKAGTLFGLDVVQDYEPLAPAAYHTFLSPIEPFNVDAPLFWGRFVVPPEHPAWRLLDRLAVRWVVVAPGVAWSPLGEARFRLVYDAPDARIFENRDALPRARLVANAAVIPDAEAALRAVHAGRTDPRSTVVVDRPLASGSGDGSVRWDRAANDEVTLTVTTSGPSVLVLADLYWPGWHAAVDGVEQPIARADYLFRAVAVPAGRHEVGFRYEPPSLRIGTATTVAGIGIVALVLASARRRRPSAS